MVEAPGNFSPKVQKDKLNKKTLEKEVAKAASLCYYLPREDSCKPYTNTRKRGLG